MKALSIIGIIVSVLTPFLILAGLEEMYCSSSYCSDGYSYAYLAGDGKEIVLLVSMLVSMFFLAFSIVSLVKAIRAGKN